MLDILILILHVLVHGVAGSCEDTTAGLCTVTVLNYCTQTAADHLRRRGFLSGLLMTLCPYLYPTVQKLTMALHLQSLFSGVMITTYLDLNVSNHKTNDHQYQTLRPWTIKINILVLGLIINWGLTPIHCQKRSEDLFAEEIEIF